MQKPEMVREVHSTTEKGCEPFGGLFRMVGRMEGLPDTYGGCSV